MPAGHIELRKRAEHNKKTAQRAGGSNALPKRDEKESGGGEVKSTLALVALVIIVGGVLWQLVDLVVKNVEQKTGAQA